MELKIPTSASVNIYNVFRATAVLVTLPFFTGGCTQLGERAALAQERGNDNTLCLDGAGNISQENSTLGIYLKGYASGVLGASRPLLYSFGTYNSGNRSDISIQVRGKIAGAFADGYSSPYGTYISTFDGRGTIITPEMARKVINTLRIKAQYRAEGGILDANGSCGYSRVSQNVSVHPILGL